MDQISAPQTSHCSIQDHKTQPSIETQSLFQRLTLKKTNSSLGMYFVTSEGNNFPTLHSFSPSLS